jgi:HEAT repeats
MIKPFAVNRSAHHTNKGIRPFASGLDRICSPQQKPIKLPGKSLIHGISMIILGLATVGFGSFLYAADQTPSLANAFPQQTKHPITLTLPSKGEGEIHLTVIQRLLPEVLAELAARSGTVIHFHSIPNVLVTVACTGKSVVTLMPCLLNGRMDFVLKTTTSGFSGHRVIQHRTAPTELWLLPATTDSTPTKTLVQAAPPPKAVETQDKDRLRLAATLQEAGSENTDQRATAIYNLGLTGEKDDPQIKETLRLALRDEDANVRAQAKAAIQQRGDEDLLVELNQLGNDTVTALDDAEAENKAMQQAALLRQASKLDEASALKLLHENSGEMAGVQDE